MNTELIPQLWAVLCFLLAGAFSAFFSDLLFSVRCILQGKLAETLLDFFLLSFCAAVVFLTTVSIVQDTLRGYMLAAFLVGFVFWEKTAGRCLRWLLGGVFRTVARVFHKACRILVGRWNTKQKSTADSANEKFCKKTKKAGKNTSIFSGNGVK